MGGHEPFLRWEVLLNVGLNAMGKGPIYYTTYMSISIRTLLDPISLMVVVLKCESY